MHGRNLGGTRRSGRAWAITLATVLLAVGTVFVGPRSEARSAAPASRAVAGLTGAPSALAGSGSGSTDFTGDGRSDILWYAQGSGPDYLWTGRSGGFGSRSVSFGGTSTSVVGDFDGDGADDVLWYAPGAAADFLWRGSSSGFSSRSVTISGTYQPVVGDFDGNGADDVLWYAPGAAADFLWRGSSSGFSSRSVTISGTYQPVVGDFDGNDRDDIFWYAPGPSGDFLWTGTSGGFRSSAWTVTGTYRPITGDFDGDGRIDVVWYAPGAAADFWWRGTASGFSSRQVGIGGWYQPVVGDFDGNGADDVLWYAAGAAADFLWSGTSGGFRSSPSAISGTYQPVTGDYDGDDRTDILWYAPGPAGDYLWHSGTGSRFAQRDLTINGNYRPLPWGVLQSPPSTTAGYAVAAGAVSLHLPSTRTLYVGFHQSASRYALDQVPRSTPVRTGVLPSRYRGTGARTAADLVLPFGEPVLSPVSGVVVEARTYGLYGRYTDEYVVIAPYTYPGEVHALHLSGLRVRAGDQVFAGVTQIAGGARRLPFESQVDEYSGHPTAPHVHFEVSSRPAYRDPDIYG